MPSEPLDPLQVAVAVGRAFDRLGAAYFVGGSLASSFQGEPRATNDIDFVVDLEERHIHRLVAELGTEFEIDAEALADAVRRRDSWNIFYLPAMIKIDLFIRRRTPFDESEFSRRLRMEVRPGEALVIKSPEDTVLRKLLLFREGGKVSTTQWRDVVQVLRVSGSGLDGRYLDDWAGRLQLSDLLAQARAEAQRDTD